MGVTSTAVTAGTNASYTQYNSLRSDHVLGVNNVGVDADSATIAIDWSSLSKGRVRTIGLAGNRTVTFSNPTAGQSIILVIKQTVGSNTIAWPTTKWAGATAPVLTTTINRYDIISFFYDGTDYFGTVVGQNYG